MQQRDSPEGMRQPLQTDQKSLAPVLRLVLEGIQVFPGSYPLGKLSDHCCLRQRCRLFDM